MLKAIYKPTGEIVSAFRIENDATWFGKQNDEWIAPRYMVFDYKEKGDVKVFFVKSHEREGLPVVAHFKHESNREIYDQENESPEHKLAKGAVYEAICNGQIKIDDKPLKEQIIDLQFEYPLSNSKKSKIADVIAIFKERHPIYGKGVIFEVQFSRQIEEITQDRTFNRVSEGYSVCWLWDGDFDEKNKLKTDRERIVIIPFAKALEEYQKIIEDKSISRVNEAGLLLDKKINSLNNYLIHYKDNLLKESKKHLDEFREMTQAELNWLGSAKDTLNKESSEKIGQVRKEILNLDNELKNLKKDIEREAIEKTSLDLKELSETLKEELLKEFNKTKIDLSSEFLKQFLQTKNFDDEIRFRLRDEIKKIVENSNIENSGLLVSYADEQIRKVLNFDNIKPIIDEAMKNRIHIQTGNFSKCHKCNKILEVREAEYDKGWAYCYNCFQTLEDNWQKIALKEEKRDGRNTLN
jgi:hypothetical protein